MRSLAIIAITIIPLSAFFLSDRIDSSTIEHARAQERDKTALHDYREQDLKRDQAKTPLPNDLLKVYQDFVKTTRKPTAEALAAFCLPRSIKITKSKRPEEKREYGEDMNLQFLVSGFQPAILDVHKEDGDCYLINTASSSLRFVKTASSGWKLYGYLDKPME
jgi:hypothetical protein